MTVTSQSNALSSYYQASMTGAKCCCWQLSQSESSRYVCLGQGSLKSIRPGLLVKWMELIHSMSGSIVVTLKIMLLFLAILIFKPLRLAAWLSVGLLEQIVRITNMKQSGASVFRRDETFSKSIFPGLLRATSGTMLIGGLTRLGFHSPGTGGLQITGGSVGRWGVVYEGKWKYKH